MSDDVDHISDALWTWIERFEFLHETTGRQRLPVLRRGQREEIDWLTRKLVLRRDNHHCKRCAADELLQLDHVVAWSNLGSDRSDNLQTLCDICNNERSNFWEVGFPERVIGVTAVCDACLAIHTGSMWDLHDRSGLWFACPICRGEENWFGLDRVPAYCGTCDWTSWVSDRNRIL